MARASGYVFSLFHWKNTALIMSPELVYPKNLSFATVCKLTVNRWKKIIYKILQSYLEWGLFDNYFVAISNRKWGFYRAGRRLPSENQGWIRQHCNSLCCSLNCIFSFDFISNKYEAKFITYKVTYGQQKLPSFDLLINSFLSCKAFSSGINSAPRLTRPRYNKRSLTH